MSQVKKEENQARIAFEETAKIRKDLKQQMSALLEKSKQHAPEEGLKILAESHRLGDAYLKACDAEISAWRLYRAKIKEFANLQEIMASLTNKIKNADKIKKVVNDVGKTKPQKALPLPKEVPGKKSANLPKLPLPGKKEPFKCPTMVINI